MSVFLREQLGESDDQGAGAAAPTVQWVLEAGWFDIGLLRGALAIEGYACGVCHPIPGRTPGTALSRLPPRSVRSPWSICYTDSMTKEQVKQVLERVLTWPHEAQEELVRSALDIERRHVGDGELTQADWKIIEERSRDARGGDIATDQEVAAVFDRYRRA
jgi:hypothetical protein